MKKTIDPNEKIVKPRHTKEKSNKKFGGWDQEGLKRYSNIAQLINVERKMTERIDIEEEYRKMYYDKLNGSEEQQEIENKSATTGSSYVAYNDLGTDEDIAQNNIMMLKNDILQEKTESANEIIGNENDCMLTDSQDIAYGQDQDFTLPIGDGNSVDHEEYNYTHTEGKLDLNRTSYRCKFEQNNDNRCIYYFIRTDMCGGAVRREGKKKWQVS